VKRIHMAAATLNQTALDWDGNRTRILSAMEAARAEGVEVLCLPELAITGYGCEDAFQGGWVAEQAWKELQALLPASVGMACCVGLPVRLRGSLYNGAALMVDGTLAGVACKQHLASDGIHYESRWFRPWPENRRAVVDPGDVPIGDLFFEVDGLRIGFEICEDAWVAGRPGRVALERELDVILNPSASHFAFGKQEVRKRLVLEGSRAFGVAYLYANLLGNEAGRVVYDGGAMVAACGELLGAAPRLSFADFQLAVASVDLDHIRNYRARSPSMAGNGNANGAEAVEPVRATLRIRGAQDAHAPSRPAAWEAGADRKEQELARAVALGLYDYARKSKVRGFVVSLSGGADSAAVACLVWLAAQLSAAELGVEQARQRLGLAPVGDAQAGMQELLHCIYQATENSGETTEHAARTLSEALGAHFARIDVQPMVDAYTALGPALFGRSLSWTSDDVALQNVQARARAPGAWLLANVLNALLLTTSNRSEAAVGYATMDGDTCGGLAPVAGIDKAYLRQWLRWLERQGPAETGPIAALAHVNAQQPTAELRPPTAGQTDETDLMPYDVLDAIERAAIRDKHPPATCLQLLAEQFPGTDPADRKRWVRRFFELWARNQWKRERYAPSFHLDDENLDPKTWCRFPILSGGFRKELADL
jgi:NAD+ synthase (glutamine-hydrolysing)